MKNKPLKSIYQGFLKIGDLELECHVLEDGQRIFSSRDILKAFGLETESRDQPYILALFLTKIRFISIGDNNLTNPINQPIKFTREGKGGLPANGYMAELIPEICNAILRLASNMILPVDLRNAADRSRQLLNSFAKVGIIALVDEATGYQDVRDKRALQDILDKFLRPEYAAWAKRFPDEFYREIFRLKNWEWRGMSVNRPSVVGKYTNAIVYARLAPGVLVELENRNPLVEAGRRKSKHHQWLTDDTGHPALNNHLFAVMAMMRGSTSWGQFNRLLARAFPLHGQQNEFDLEDEQD